jgi:hypothetical protein
MFVATLSCGAVDLYLLKIAYNEPGTDIWQLDVQGRYEEYLRFRGTTASVLLCILTLSLITANTTLIRILNKIQNTDDL